MIEELQPTSRREQAKDSRRSRIVDATYALLREHAVADLSVKMIADQAGVSPATVYNLFGTKAAVMEKVYDRDLEDFQQRMTKTPSKDSLERIFDSVAILANHYNSDPRFYRSISVMQNTGPGDAELIDAINARNRPFWADLVRKAIQDGHLRADTDLVGVGASMNLMASGAVGAWVNSQMSIEHYERFLTFGFAAVLVSFATQEAQARLQEKMTRPASRPAAARKIKAPAE